ncbi:uncharacterized protein LOC144700794 [Wolffia australiana]
MAGIAVERRRYRRQWRRGDEEDEISAAPLKKESFRSAGILRGLGCSSAAAAQAYSPAAAAAAAVRSSADWQVKQGNCRRKKIKAPWKKAKSPHSNAHSRRNAAGGDIWCAPGIPFASSADDSVECVVSQSHSERFAESHSSLPSWSRSGRLDAGDRFGSDRNYNDRRGGRRIEQLSSFLDSLPESAIELPFLGSDQMPWRHPRHQSSSRISSRGGLEEIMMLQSRLLLSSTIDLYDQYRDLRLDVDNMSYEELLDLGEKIGQVSTGLREEDIFQCLKKTRLSVFAWANEKSCSICQEDFLGGHELARLPCGHTYHVPCIRQWLLRKNTCPVCKAPPSKP